MSCFFGNNEECICWHTHPVSKEDHGVVQPSFSQANFTQTGMDFLRYQYDSITIWSQIKNTIEAMNTSNLHPLEVNHFRKWKRTKNHHVWQSSSPPFHTKTTPTCMIFIKVFTASSDEGFVSKSLAGWKVYTSTCKWRSTEIDDFSKKHVWKSWLYPQKCVLKIAKSCVW